MEAKENGSNIEIISFYELLELLGVALEGLNAMDCPSFCEFERQRKNEKLYSQINFA